jgi:hypothetical protein
MCRTVQEVKTRESRGPRLTVGHPAAIRGDLRFQNQIQRQVLGLL